MEWEDDVKKLNTFLRRKVDIVYSCALNCGKYDSIATVGEIRVWWRADFQSGSRVLKKVF